MNAADKYFDELQERIKKHPGKPIFDATQVYGTSLNFLFGNCNQLRQLLRVLEDPKDPTNFTGFDNRQQRQSLFDETNRHFHNFLTSITTLVDHTRNLMKEDFIESQHREEYQGKVKTVFASDPLAQFLQDFRNYITHYAIPHIGLEKRFHASGTGADPGELFIDLDHLESKFHWSVPSRKFIESNKPKIRMLKLVDDYEFKARAFTDELMATFRKHRGKELDEVVALMQESNNLWTKIFEDMEKATKLKPIIL
jgi:hypothetical protein